jgi:hypothetical protein
MRLPEKPQYNFTWDSFRHSIQNQMFYGEFYGSTKRSNRTLYEKERQEYDRKLEAYAEAMQDADRWVEIENEVVLWETQAQMGFMPEPDHHSQYSKRIRVNSSNAFTDRLPNSRHGPIRHHKSSSQFYNLPPRRKTSLFWRKDTTEKCHGELHILSPLLY